MGYKKRLSVSSAFPSLTDGLKVPQIFWIKINRWCKNGKHIRKLANQHVQSKKLAFVNRTTFK